MDYPVEQITAIQKLYRSYRLKKKLKAALAQYQKTMNEAFNFPIHPAPKTFRDYYKNDAYDQLLAEYFELKQSLEPLQSSQPTPSD